VSATGYPAVGTAPLGVTLGEALLPRSIRDRATAWQRDAILIVAGTALITLGAYVSFTVPAIQLGQLYVPINEYVPITLQTFGVLFTGALLGTWRGASASGLYLLLGIVGLPVFAADPETGLHPTGIERLASFSDGQLVLGSTGGYLLGFIVAAALVGRLAELGWDRRLVTSIAAMVAGTIAIYALGVAWLAVAADLSIGDALTFGLYPFIPIDLVKLLVAAGLLPLGWRLVSGRASEPHGGSSAPR
jgi:biotin transport system substrate-specific component